MSRCPAQPRLRGIEHWTTGVKGLQVHPSPFAVAGGIDGMNVDAYAIASDRAAVCTRRGYIEGAASSMFGDYRHIRYLQRLQKIQGESIAKVAARFIEAKVAARLQPAALKLVAFLQDGWKLVSLPRNSGAPTTEVYGHPWATYATAYKVRVAIVEQLEEAGLLDKKWELTSAGRSFNPGAKAKAKAEAGRPADVAAFEALEKEARAAERAAYNATKEANRRGADKATSLALRAAWGEAQQAYDAAAKATRQARIYKPGR